MKKNFKFFQWFMLIFLQSVLMFNKMVPNHRINTERKNV